MSDKQEGGCLCGAIRYEFSGEPFGVFHCHCSICRRAGASAFVTWAGLNADKFNFVKGDLSTFESSDDGRRGFCPTCGAQISFTFESDPDHIYITAATLDDPGSVAPSAHGFVSDAVRWLHIDDGLPEHEGNPPLLEEIMK